MLQRMRVLEEAGMRFTEKPLTALSTMGGDGGFLHAKQASSGTILELVLDGFLHPKEARRCDSAKDVCSTMALKIKQCHIHLGNKLFGNCCFCI